MRQAQALNVNVPPFGGLTLTIVIVDGLPATGSSSGRTGIVTATPRSLTVSWASAGSAGVTAAAVTATATAVSLVRTLMACGPPTARSCAACSSENENGTDHRPVEEGRCGLARCRKQGWRPDGQRRCDEAPAPWHAGPRSARERRW